jgi:hypothetical protein
MLAFNLLRHSDLMTRFLVALGFGTAWVAAAQSTSVQQIAFRLGADSASTSSFGAASCNAEQTVRWSNTLTTINFLPPCASNPLKVWATEGECGDTPAAGDKRYDDIPALTLQGVRDGNFLMNLNQLPGLTTAPSDGGVAICGTTGITRIYKVCGSIEYSVSGFNGCGTSTKLNASPLQFVYDTEAPRVPEITGAQGQDEGVRVNFSVDSDTVTVILESREAGKGDYATIATDTPAKGFIIGKSLVNDTKYEVRLRAQDGAGNTSEPSASQEIVPIRTYGIFGEYSKLGGDDPGGCQVGVGLSMALVGLWGLRRRKRPDSCDGGTRQ